MGHTVNGRAGLTRRAGAPFLSIPLSRVIEAAFGGRDYHTKRANVLAFAEAQARSARTRHMLGAILGVTYGLR